MPEMDDPYAALVEKQKKRRTAWKEEDPYAELVKRKAGTQTRNAALELASDLVPGAAVAEAALVASGQKQPQKRTIARKPVTVGISAEPVTRDAPRQANDNGLLDLLRDTAKAAVDQQLTNINRPAGALSDIAKAKVPAGLFGTEDPKVVEMFEKMGHEGKTILATLRNLDPTQAPAFVAQLTAPGGGKQTVSGFKNLINRAAQGDMDAWAELRGLGNAFLVGAAAGPAGKAMGLRVMGLAPKTKVSPKAQIKFARGQILNPTKPTAAPGAAPKVSADNSMAAPMRKVDAQGNTILEGAGGLSNRSIAKKPSQRVTVDLAADIAAARTESAERQKRSIYKKAPQFEQPEVQPRQSGPSVMRSYYGDSPQGKKLQGIRRVGSFAKPTTTAGVKPGFVEPPEYPQIKGFEKHETLVVARGSRPEAEMIEAGFEPVHRYNSDYWKAKNEPWARRAINEMGLAIDGELSMKPPKPKKGAKSVVWDGPEGKQIVALRKLENGEAIIETRGGTKKVDASEVSEIRADHERINRGYESSDQFHQTGTIPPAWKQGISDVPEPKTGRNAQGFTFYRAEIDPNEIGVKPGLQYKKQGITDAKNAITDELKNVTAYDQAAPALTVWQTRDGKLWVLNGHHRRELAIRTGEKSVPVNIFREADGMDFDTARATGALQNIMDGKGTAIDAATVLRDLNAPLDKLKQYGINTKNGVGRDALSLMKLDREALRFVEEGDVPEAVAAGIADAGLDPKRQAAAMREAARGELKTRGQGQALGEHAKGKSLVSRKDPTGNLFGEFEETLALAERAKLTEAVMTQLAKSERMFKAFDKGQAAGKTFVDAEAQSAAAARIEFARKQLATDPEAARILEEEAANYAATPTKGQLAKSVKRITQAAEEAAERRLGELGQGSRSGRDSGGGDRSPEAPQEAPAVADAPEKKIGPQLSLAPDELGDTKGQLGFDIDSNASKSTGRSDASTDWAMPSQATPQAGKRGLLQMLENERHQGRLFNEDGAYQNAKDFIESLPEELLSDLTAAIRDTVTDPKLGQVSGLYWHSKQFIELSRQVARSADPFAVQRVVVHEVSHHLQRYISKADFEALKKQYLTEKAAHMAAQAARGTGKAEYRYSSMSEWWASTIENKEILGRFMEADLEGMPLGVKRAFARTALTVVRMLEGLRRYFIRKGMADHASSVYNAILRGERDVDGGPGRHMGGKDEHLDDVSAAYQRIEAAQSAVPETSASKFADGQKSFVFGNAKTNELTNRVQRLLGIDRDVPPNEDGGSFTVDRGPQGGRWGVGSALRSPLSIIDGAGRTLVVGSYERLGGPLGREASQVIRAAEQEITALTSKWGRAMDAIESQLDAARKEAATGKGGASISKKAAKDQFYSDFVELIERPLDDPERLAASGALRKALDLHDALTEQVREYIINSRRGLGIPTPDDWGITDQGYFRHLFLGDLRVIVDGDFYGAARTYAEAQKIALDVLKKNPGAQVTAVARNVMGADALLRLSSRRFWKVTGNIADSVEVPITDILDDVRGELGEKAKRTKFFGALLERKGTEGYSRDYLAVMRAHVAQAARTQELSKLNRVLQPVIEQMKANEMVGLGQAVEDHLTHLWGTPTKFERMIGDSIRNTPYLRDHVANPDFAFRGLAMRLTRLQTNLKVAYNVRATVANLLQPYTTLWPYVSTVDFIAAYADAMNPKSRAMLADRGVISGANKLEENLTGVGHRRRTPFAVASDLNRSVGYMYGYRKALRDGLSEGQAHTSGLAWAERVEFDNSQWNAPPVIRSSQGKVLGQFKGFMLKNYENIGSVVAANEGEAPKKRIGRIAKYGTAQVAAGGLKGLGIGVRATIGYKVVGALSYQLQQLGMAREDADRLAEVVYYGAPALLGQDLSSSVGIFEAPYGDSMMEKWGNVAFGPTIGTIANLGDAGAQFLSAKDGEGKIKAIRKGARAITPYARQAEGAYEIATSPDHRASVQLGGGRKKLSLSDSVLYALGFTPVEQSRFYDKREDLGPKKKTILKKQSGNTTRGIGGKRSITKKPKYQGL